MDHDEDMDITAPVIADRREIRIERVQPGGDIGEALFQMSEAVKSAQGEGFRFAEIEFNQHSRFLQIVMTRRVDYSHGGKES